MANEKLKILKKSRSKYSVKYYVLESWSGEEFWIYFNGPKTNTYLRDDYINLKNTKVYYNTEKELKIDSEYEFEILELEQNEDNYIIVNLKDGSFQYLHKMIVFTFGDRLGNNSLYGFEVDHVNGNKERNIPENLELVTEAVNKYRAYKNKYSGSSERFSSFIKNSIDNGTFESIVKELSKEINEE